MKNVLIGVFATISLLSLGFIAYDKFTTKDEVLVKECNKEEICDECICNECNCDGEAYEETPIIESNSFYSKDGKIYKLDVYDVQKIKSENIKLNGKNIKLENKDEVLYINNKKIEAMLLYVTDYYILTGDVGLVGVSFTNIINAEGIVTNLNDNKIKGDFQAEDIYLTDSGNIVAIGGSYCGIECEPKKEILKISRNNGKLQITKEKITN